MLFFFLHHTAQHVALRGFPEAKSIHLEEKLQDVAIEINK